MADDFSAIILPSVPVSSRVCMVPGKPGKSWKFKILKSRPGKPGKYALVRENPGKLDLS